VAGAVERNPIEHPEPVRSRGGPGLRVQIVVALAGVILVAYVPLFFAIAQVTRATAFSYREEAARALGRAVASHVSDVAERDPQAVQLRLASHVGEGGAIAIVVYGASGSIDASAGPAGELALLRPPATPYGDAVTRVAARNGSRALDVVLTSRGRAVLVRVRTDEDAARSADLVRGIALYMGVFALALLVFAYIALTRAIVRPIEQLALAADRVASGSRSFGMPATGAREIAELGSSVRSMASRLIDDEKALRAKVDELITTTRHLGETRTQLEGSERMASVGRLAAGVAHEIGNPIAAIMGMHDIIEDAETPDDTRADFLKRMRKETERIHVVVRDLLDYARPENGPPSARPSPATADVSEIVDDAVALVRSQKEWKGIELNVDLEAGLSVSVSPQRLTQVLLNLLLNAGAAIADKPYDAERIVSVRARQSAEGRVRIEVDDNGPGVEPSMRDRIFDPFVTTKDVGSGTGLGLAVCRGIVEGASGRIFVDPAYTQGARFVLDLPSHAATE
jgi:signal transduction histidine kinase